MNHIRTFEKFFWHTYNSKFRGNPVVSESKTRGRTFIWRT